MMHRYARALAGIMAGLMVAGSLTGCVTRVKRQKTVTTDSVVATVVTDERQEPVTRPVVTEPVVTSPVITDPVVTEPIVTDPPVTNPPVTNPPVTNPPVTQPKTVDVTSVSLSKSSVTLTVGYSATVTVTVNPSNATDKTVKWSSSNTSVATVSGGKIVAVKAGTATITATAGGKSATLTVTVKAPETDPPTTAPIVTPPVITTEDPNTPPVTFTSEQSGDGPELIQRPLALDPDDYYGYQSLKKQGSSTTLQMVYQKLAAAVANMDDVVEIYDPTHPLTETQLKTVFFCYRYDYPQHFWLSLGYSYSLNSSGYVKRVYLKYVMTRSEAIQAQNVVNQVTDQLLEGITTSMSEYERELLVHDRLIAYVDYDTAGTALYSYTMYTALANRLATCEGYARALQYMLYQVGIQAAIVVGTARGISHAWTLVKIDGQYYYCDPTWNDPVVSSKVGYESHAYFNVTTKDLAMAKYEIYSTATMYELPICTATAANYCLKSGALAKLDAKEIAHAIGNLYNSGVRDFFSIRIDSNIVLSVDDMKSVLTIDGETFRDWIQEVTGTYPATSFFGWIAATGTNVFTFYFDKH